MIPGWVVATVVLTGAISPGVVGSAGAEEARSPAERGREALTTRCFVSPAWGLEAYQRARWFWPRPGPDPERDPEGYATAFRRRYGLHPAPYPNDGLPMGLRRAVDATTGKVGIAFDCMVCHGGSIGGASYVGLGNTQLDLKAMIDDLTRADGKTPTLALFTVNSTRGTNNAAQIAVALLQMRNPDLSFRNFPLLTGTWLPELDTPPWWLLHKKSTKYYDGRTDARATRSNMQFMLGELSLAQLQALEPTFQDIDAYLRSLRPPRYPFPIDRVQAERGLTVFEGSCARCHGTYGPGGTYPNRVVPIEVIGTDPARLKGMSQRFIDHYNSTWLGADYPVEEPMLGYQAPPLDGIWATAPYLHNGTVPTIYHLLKSSVRPVRFRRPPSTDFAHYDTERVGWKAEVVTEAPPPHESRWIVDTSRWGLGNRGHTFGDKLTDEQRRDVIEYLKTL